MRYTVTRLREWINRLNEHALLKDANSYLRLECRNDSHYVDLHNATTDQCITSLASGTPKEISQYLRGVMDASKISTKFWGELQNP